MEGPVRATAGRQTRDLFAPGAASRAHGALRRPRRRQRHPSGQAFLGAAKDDRLARIRRARGRRPLHRRHRGAAGAASRQGQDGTVASLGAAHVEPGHKGTLPGPHTRRRTPAGRDFGAVQALDAAGQPLADLRRDQSARARPRAGGRRARPTSTSLYAWCRCCDTSPCRHRGARSTRFLPSCPFPTKRGTTRASRVRSKTSYRVLGGDYGRNAVMGKT